MTFGFAILTILKPKVMKATVKYFTLLFAFCFFMASCSSDRNEQVAKDSVKDLRSYVDSVNRTEEMNSDWGSIEMKYNEKADKVEVATAQVKENEQLKADYEKIKADYAALKTKYDQQQAMVYKRTIRDALFGEGVVGRDINFNFMTAANARGVYERFVNSVASNKDTYSREDWDEVKVLYEAMDSRKNEIEPQLAGADNRKIAGLKVRFASIKAVNRPGTKIDENQLAKSE